MDANRYYRVNFFILPYTGCSTIILVDKLSGPEDISIQNSNCTEKSQLNAAIEEEVKNTCPPRDIDPEAFLAGKKISEADMAKALKQYNEYTACVEQIITEANK